MSSDNSAKEALHWAKTRYLSIWVLIIWFIFSFVVHLFAKSLNEFSLNGFPLGYYFAVQGSLIIFVVLIVVQNLLQDKIDNETGLSSE